MELVSQSFWMWCTVAGLVFADILKECMPSCLSAKGFKKHFSWDA
jgi:hypothetical protein